MREIVLYFWGETNNDGNDTLYRAGLAKVMRPAEALFDQEKAIMEAALAVIKTTKLRVALI